MMCGSITGTNGVLKPPKGYLEGIRAMCNEYGILMVCDEGVCVGFATCSFVVLTSFSVPCSHGWVRALGQAVRFLPRSVGGA
jgi:taurine--2-oxoglutarate transaminase